jgi:hypothetical protein
MATKQEVKKYLAHWFQLGKKVIFIKGNHSILPQPVLRGETYSPEFEDCWQTILKSEISDCYLEGTQETIADLLTPTWEILPCGRCAMPVPLKSLGMPSLLCPCYSLDSWPNTDLPAPRCPVNNQDQLKQIHNRLLETSSVYSPSEN